MNRALLERLSEYQPKRGIASSSSSPFSLFFWLAMCCVVAVVYPAMIVMNGCSPAEVNAAGAQAEVAEGEIDYHAKITKCRLDVGADGGTFRDFQKCACDVDRSFGLDASSAGAVCP